MRCGKCNALFNGISGLTDEAGTAQRGARGEPSPSQGRLRLEPDSQPDGGAGGALRPKRRWPWLLGASALLALFAAQVLLHHRTEVVLHLPAWRAPLEEACARLGCSVGLPRRSDLLALESSDLQSENRREGVVVLNAVLRNRAPFAQEYPSLELTLTDETDHAVLRRVLAPEHYLPELTPARRAQGLAVGAEAALRVHLDIGNARAVGYRLYLFFP